VEHLTYFTSEILGKSRTPSLFLFPYLRVVFVVVTGFAVVNLGVGLLAGHSIAPSPDPFAAYADVFPGQPRSAVVGRGFTCPTTAYGGYHQPGEETCVLWPRTGTFFQVTARVSQDVIRHITFTARDHALRLGDLVALWGRPESRGHDIQFVWPGRCIVALTYAFDGQFSLLPPVRNVSFTDASLPDAMQ
jgi:hypothetical protein